MVHSSEGQRPELGANKSGDQRGWGEDGHVACVWPKGREVLEENDPLFVIMYKVISVLENEGWSKEVGGTGQGRRDI